MVQNQDFSQDEYDAIKDFALGKLAENKGVSVERLIANKVQREAGLTPAEAVDELIADGCEMMLKNESWLQALKETEPGIARRILSFLKRWLGNLRAAFRGVKAQSAEAKAMLEHMDELQALWNRGLAAAVDTYRRTEKNTAEDGGVVQYKGRESGEATSIKEQIAKNAERLNAMEVVATVNVSGIKGKSIKEKRRWAETVLKQSGYIVDRLNFGKIVFEPHHINEGLTTSKKTEK